MATHQDAIDIARPLLNDIDAAAYRWSNDFLTQAGNDALDVISGILPQLFYKTGEITCISGTVNQLFAARDARRLITILNVKDGNVVNKTTVAMLDAFNPGWRSADPGTATDWAPAEDDPLAFYISPPSPNSQKLIGKYEAVPAEYTLSETHVLANSYTPVIAEFMVFRALDIHTEAGDPEGAQTHLTRFASMLGVDKANIIPPKQ